MSENNAVTVKMSSKGQIVIPVNIRKALNINSGDIYL
ncbi:AbrB/MazE/SpoVT family DNA-binding domain-containing protein [Apilactobacillus ozensis]|nr:AbrB/MazE/SpoVT family DNA-binding domain-containing protein [Apilactobacillus ozensis]MCK8607251.1 AbrB/MazE/SpoVT family DNA-binding domain-containing protein [Apilactobacillus ozensis]